MRPLTLTTFPDNYAQKKDGEVITFDALEARLRDMPAAPTKEHLSLLKLQAFGESRTKKNCLRHNANVLSVDGVEIDVDDGVLSFDEVVTRLQDAHLEALVITSPSYTREKPRLRALLPYSQTLKTRPDLMSTARANTVARVNGLLGGHVSTETFTLSQAFYFGRVEGREYRVARTHGREVDLAKDLDAGAVFKHGVVPERSGEPQETHSLEYGTLVAQVLKGEHYHTALRSLTSKMAASGVERHVAQGLLEGIFDAALDRGDKDKHAAEIERTLDSAYEKFKKSALSRVDGRFSECATEVQSLIVEWAWKNRLALGALHILAGRPGTGKSTMGFGMAAAISKGGTWPDGTKAPQGNVVIWSGEDDYARTIKPRLIAAGADMSRVFFLTGAPPNAKGEATPFDPSLHMEVLLDELHAIKDVKFLMIDSIVSAVKGDSHKNAEVRRDLMPLVKLLQELNAVGLGVTHYTKGTDGKDPIERVTGSIAFGALARVILCTVKEKDVLNSFRVVVGKSNICPEGGGYAYSIEQLPVRDGPVALEASRIVWGEALEGDARLLIEEAEKTAADRGRPPEQMKKAIDLLQSTIINGTPVDVKILKSTADAHEISWDTMKRARKQLGMEPVLMRREGRTEVWGWRRTLTFDAVDQDIFS